MMDFQAIFSICVIKKQRDQLANTPAFMGSPKQELYREVDNDIYKPQNINQI